MTTQINTITALLPRLTPDQLQTIETYVAWFYRQNLTNSIATLPAESLVGFGTVVEIFTNPRAPIVIPPPPQHIVVPPPPAIENPVPQPLLPDLPPSPLVIAEGELGAAPTAHTPRHYTVEPLHLIPPPTTTQQPQHQQPQHQQPQLQPLSINVTCQGCINGQELSAWTHTWAEGCYGSQGAQDQDNYEDDYDSENYEDDYDNAEEYEDEYEEDRRFASRDDHA